MVGQVQVQASCPTEVSPDDTMPGWVVFLVKLLLDEGGDILLDVVLLQCLHIAHVSLQDAGDEAQETCTTTLFTLLNSLMDALTWVAQSMASACISSLISAFLITAASEHGLITTCVSIVSVYTHHSSLGWPF